MRRGARNGIEGRVEGGQRTANGQAAPQHRSIRSPQLARSQPASPRAPLQSLSLLTPLLVGLNNVDSAVLLGPLSAGIGATNCSPGGLSATLAVVANGPGFMMEALQMALPGIDANDLDKMANT